MYGIMYVSAKENEDKRIDQRKMVIKTVVLD
jgi:hypothetical protein